jgi:hypothetical protein
VSMVKDMTWHVQQSKWLTASEGCARGYISEYCVACRCLPHGAAAAQHGRLADNNAGRIYATAYGANLHMPTHSIQGLWCREHRCILKHKKVQVCLPSGVQGMFESVCGP